MIVAVTGATGYVGRFIVSRLIRSGYSVRAWRRPSSDLTGLPEGIAWIEGELGAQDSAEALVDGADVLVHAALAHVAGRYRGGEGDDLPRFWRQNVDGSAALLEAARKAGVTRAVVFSSRAVFGRAQAGPLDDDAEPAPDTHYGAAKSELETYVRKFGKAWPIAALRPTGIYGIVEPVARSKWYSLAEDALAGRPVVPRAATEVHGDDVACSVLRLLTADAEAIAGHVFNCSDIVVSHREIVALVQGIAGIAGPLPEEGPPPQGVMRTDALARLGVTFGGRKLFEETIFGLVAAARQHRPR